jgi:hypothetical protein
MKLSLDTAALEALFPPGSEARVELSRAVVANLLSRLATKDLRVMSDDLRGIVKQQIKDDMAREGLVSRFTGTVQLSDQARSAIKDEVSNAFYAEIRSAVTDVWAEKETSIALQIDSRVQSIINSPIRATLKEVVREVLREGFTK